jgi:hypothetical protein
MDLKEAANRTAPSAGLARCLDLQRVSRLLLVNKRHTLRVNAPPSSVIRPATILAT